MTEKAALLIPLFSCDPKRVPADGVFTVGRSRNASLDIVSLEVSRCHCTIHKKVGKKEVYWVVCDKSSVGTWLNDTQLIKNKDTRIKDHDKIRVGLSFYFIFCTGGADCANRCKEAKQANGENGQDECTILAESITRAKCGVKELQILQDELKASLHEKMNGIEQKFELQSVSQTPDEVERLKNAMEAEKNEIKKQYTKEIADLGERLNASHAEQEHLRQQIESLFEERGRDSEALRELSSELDQAKQDYTALNELKTSLENRLKEYSTAVQTAAENTRKEFLNNMGELLESELQCCICNDLFVCAVTLNCSHTFCEYCIRSWRRTSNFCPMCRACVTGQTRAIVIDSYIDRAVANLSDDLKERRRTIVREREAANQALLQAANQAPQVVPPVTAANQQVAVQLVQVESSVGQLSANARTVWLRQVVNGRATDRQAIVVPAAQHASEAVRTTAANMTATGVVRAVAAAVAPAAAPAAAPRAVSRAVSRAAPTRRVAPAVSSRNVRPRTSNGTLPPVIDLTSSPHGRRR